MLFTLAPPLAETETPSAALWADLPYMLFTAARHAVAPWSPEFLHTAVRAQIRSLAMCSACCRTLRSTASWGRALLAPTGYPTETRQSPRVARGRWQKVGATSPAMLSCVLHGCVIVAFAPWSLGPGRRWFVCLWLDSRKSIGGQLCRLFEVDRGVAWELHDVPSIGRGELRSEKDVPMIGVGQI